MARKVSCSSNSVFLETHSIRQQATKIIHNFITSRREKLYIRKSRKLEYIAVKEYSYYDLKKGTKIHSELNT